MDNLILTFTEDEHRMVKAAHQRYLQVLSFIAELHGLTGALDVDPDLTGFIQTGTVPAKM
jgi:hypothetical protein